MITPSSPVPGASFSRKRTVRTVSSIASVGLLAGISLVAASPAMAATDADCTVGNTVDASTGSAADIQTLLDGSEAVICLSGTFAVTTTLLYDRDLTIHGLTDAVLDGGDAVGILEDDGSNTLTVENIRFTNGNGSDGGAINGYDVLVYNSQFDNNYAFGGGAINAYSAEIYDSLFFDNEAEYPGGAVSVNEYVSVTRSTFRTNVADGGGAIYSYGVAYSDASTFVGNTSNFAGALAANDGAYVQNSTFVDNTATDDGGAISGGGGTVRQSTFLNNTAASGQSIHGWEDNIELRGNIFASSGASANLTGAVVDQGANLFTTSQATETALAPAQATSKFGLTVASLFDGATLADNGGPTQTVALHGASPALSAVPAAPDSMTEDQRGVARPAVSDAGAYEYTGAVAVLAATGSEPAGWLAGAVALLLAGAAALGLTRRTRRSI